MNERKPIRQGDVLLVPVDKLPEGFANVARDQYDRIVLAEGEAHGHAHAFRDKGVTAFRAETAEMAEAAGIAAPLRAMVDFIEVGGATALTHEYSDGKQADHNPAPV